MTVPSTAVKDKITKLETIRIRARTIMSEHEKNGLPPEEELQVKTLTEEATKLREEIAAEQKLEQQKADLADLDRYLDAPERKIPHGINGSSEEHSERKTLERAGWEFKGGMVYKQTSLGTSVPMFSEDVLFGEIPERDANAAEFYRTTRGSMAHDYKMAYEHLVKATGRYGAAALSMLSGAEQKALSEGTDTSGGFLVPPDVQAEMLVRVAQMAIMRQNCRVQPTNRDTLRWPAVAPNAGTYNSISGASIYSSGFVGGWVGETPAFSDTDPSFQTLDIPIKKLRVATRLSNDFIADAAVNILAFMAQNGAENMALTEDLGFIQGTGAGLQPTGLLNVGISTVDVEGAPTTDQINNDSTHTGSAPKLVNLAYQLPAQYVGRAKWIMRRSVEGKIRQLVDADGRFLWPPYAGSAFAPAPAELLGFPVLHSDWMPADGQDTQPVLYLGDLSNYIIGQRTQITSVVLRERFADTDQTAIILFERLGGSSYNVDAARLGIC